MAFNLRSGNKTSFKNIGSSPAKETVSTITGTPVRTPVKQSLTNKQRQENLLKAVPNEEAFNKLSKEDQKSFTDAWVKSEGVTKKVEVTKDSPAKQKVEKGQGELKKGQDELKKQTNSWKGTEGQDQDKILNAKGEHIGDWVGDKKVMFTQEQIEDAKGVTTNINMPKVHVDPPKHKTHGAGDTGNWEPHQFRTKKKKSPAKQTATTFADGSKKSARDMFNDQETAIEQRKADRKDNQKSPYWYKIDGKSVTRAQYLKYKNKPGNMEGGGKQTNNPDVHGKIANNHARGPKTKK